MKKITYEPVPVYQFENDANTGIFKKENDALGVVICGHEIPPVALIGLPLLGALTIRGIWLCIRASRKREKQ